MKCGNINSIFISIICRHVSIPVQASPVMGLAVSALSSPLSSPSLHEAAADCMIALLTRIEREECAELERCRHPTTLTSCGIT